MRLNLKLYLISVVTGASFFGIFLYRNYRTDILLADIVFFLLLLFITENASYIFLNFLDLSTSFILPVLFPLLATHGPFWAAFITSLATVQLKFRNNRPIWYKELFNRAMIFITVGVASLVYHYVYLQYGDIILSFILTSLTYFIVNNALLYIVLWLTDNVSKTFSQYLLQLSKKVLFSFFIGSLLYLVYVNYGKLMFSISILVLYIFKDFFNARIKQLDIQNKLNKTKEELEYSELKNIFFRNISHEFKTPLNLIFSTLKIMELKDEDGKNEKYINILRQNSYRLLRLVNNLLDISKIDSGSFSLNMKNTDIIKLINTIVISVRDFIEEKNKSIIFETNLGKKIITCDPDRIERVLLNLISNAIKFTDEGDLIKISVFQDRQKDFLCIAIEDTGIGIKKEKQKVIFKPFHQVDDSLTRNHQGSGLGLAIVKSLVEMHNGEIELYSEYGKGSKFIIKLPDRTLSTKEVSRYNQQEAGFNKIKMELSDVYK